MNKLLISKFILNNVKMNSLYILLIVIPFTLAIFTCVWYCAKYSVERELCVQEINSEMSSNLTRRGSVDTLPPYTQELEEVVIKDLPNYEDIQTTTMNN
jgi:cell division protein FtsL